MFLKNLIIKREEVIIREISFRKGLNLIIDETKQVNKKESGNNVGKTTVLRLVDYCFGSSGENIYRDPEFRDKSNTQIETFLKNNNVTILMTLKEDLDKPRSREITIIRNFLKYKKKIQLINGESYPNGKDFDSKLKQLIFKSTAKKPSVRQIVSKNIRHEKNSLINTIKVLHPTTTLEEYEALWEPLKTSLLDFQLKIKRLEPDAIEVKNIKKMLNSHFLNIFRISKKNQA
ncbi:hypothetical protein LEP1GSC024_4332 [Leptospira noguchii str. 2001034031]|uniref:DUF2326 domain-containing protein n=1 Tax=Leptospira noguchii str. 2001034031 TaxID=1193053 RepID=M6Y9U3_9LEPT|nr:hypothetical protein LEP1GSC024_4332 [Leptospira noguchii str. 2001034031]